MMSDPNANAPVLTIPHMVERLTIDVGQSFELFCRRYEAAVPKLDRDRLTAIVERGGTWEEVVADVDASAPYGFFIFWKMDAGEIMRIAGHTNACVEYLMGNYAIGAQMFGHDPSVMLYAPLRTVIYTDAVGRTCFAIDRPSTVFASFGSTAIAEVGLDLDRKLGTLLTALEVPVPDQLGTAKL